MTRKGHFIPLANILWIQVVYDGQCIKLVETRSYFSVLDVRKTAQMHDEIGASALAGQLIARSLDVPIRQTQTLAGHSQPRARLEIGSREIIGMAQTSNRHDEKYL